MACDIKLALAERVRTCYDRVQVPGWRSAILRGVYR